MLGSQRYFLLICRVLAVTGNQVSTRTRVKICGITRAQDATAAAQLGVDALGLVFYEKSPRNLSCQQAQAVVQVLPGFVSSVALFLNPSESQVKQVLTEVNIDLLQFHGNETPEFCESFGRPYIKAMGVDRLDDLPAESERYASARSILLDSHVQGAAGGTGEVFDWDQIPDSLRQKIILAGGLNPDNVARAITEIEPYAVDLSSGVESAPGIKDIELMARLMQEVKRVDCAR